MTAGITKAIVTDIDELEFHSQDVFTRGPTPSGVFRPDSVEALVAGVKAAAEQGLAIVPRGGGMSYTSGYIPAEAGALIVDTGALDRIVAVDETDMTVTVEAGVTWKQLYEELHPRGLRTPLWGTLSGIKATVGGGMSQNGLFWGSRNGSIAATALSFDVVLADGTLLTTGSKVLRPFGPDVTGLFAADCGALGIKARVTLPLVPEADALAYGSFAFETPDQFTAATSAIARAGLASECFGFDPFLQAQRMKRDSLTADAKALVGMMKSQGGFWRGLKEGAKVVAAGRSFHAGRGNWQGVTSGNTSFIGIEAENAGRDDPWPAVQLDAYRRGVAAILKKVRANALMCCGHKEFALPSGRKPDPTFDMSDFRRDVAAIMAGTAPGPSIVPAADADGRPTLRRGATGALVREIQTKVGAPVTGTFDAITEALVRVFQRRHELTPDGIVGPRSWATLAEV